MTPERFLYPNNFLIPEIKTARGVFLRDKNGKEYLDFSSSAGVVNVGYGEKKIIKVLTAAAKKPFIPQWSYSDDARKLLNELSDLLPHDLNAVMRAVTGSEAVEIALQMAFDYTGKKTILSFEGAYHGHTLAAGRLGDSQPEEKSVGLNFIALPHPYKEKTNKQGDNILGKIEKIMKKGDCAAVITEGLTTNAGCLPFPDGFFKKLLSLSQQYGALLIFDEVLTGFGRTGKMFSFQHHEITPDIVCLSKGFSSGYAAIAAAVTRKEIAENFSYFSTFAWPPLACAAAAENVKIIKRKKLASRAEVLGKFALAYLKDSLKINRSVKDIRGLGLLMAVEFENHGLTPGIFKAAKANGLVLFKNESPGILFIQPPLIITKKELERGLNLFIKALSNAEELNH